MEVSYLFYYLQLDNTVQNSSCITTMEQTEKKADKSYKILAREN